jgi:hypothetical protein
MAYARLPSSKSPVGRRRNVLHPCTAMLVSGGGDTMPSVHGPELPSDVHAARKTPAVCPATPVETPAWHAQSAQRQRQLREANSQHMVLIGQQQHTLLQLLHSVVPFYSSVRSY